jgi:phosphomannomutase / phosphoglucomutase
MTRFSDRLKSVARFPVRKVETVDGFKYYVENGWLLVRPSGTEPLIRYYAEADSIFKIDQMLQWAKGE